jgi:oligoribonuclease NrnB/cAMP/cGMP phosphodiesterase (DHH superfamily)
MRTIVISHNADIDGIGCAALFKMKYGTRDADIFLIDYSTEALWAVEKSIRRMKPKATDLFVTDLSANDEKVGLFLSIISVIKRGGGKVRWFDHHPWSVSSARKISKECETIICGERDECASEITARQLKMKGKFVSDFLKVCHASDFNLKPRDRRSQSLIKTYALGIARYNIGQKANELIKLKALANTISNGKMTNTDLVSAAREFEKVSKERISVMKKGLVPVGGNIAVGFAKSLQSTNACYHIIKASGKDIGIFINLDAKKGNIRSIKRDISPLAMSLGGGGHPHASGFSFDKKRYRVNTEKGRELILKRIEEAARETGVY